MRFQKSLSLRRDLPAPADYPVSQDPQAQMETPEETEAQVQEVLKELK